MPRRVPLPAQLHGTAFQTSHAERHGTTRGRLRRADVDHPFHAVSSVDVDLNVVTGRCAAYQSLARDGRYFSHITAARLFGMPLPDSPVADEPLHVAAFTDSARPRGRGIRGHMLSVKNVATARVAGFDVISPADTWCQLAATLNRYDLVAVGDYLISGARTAFGRVPALATAAELVDACARHRGCRGARALAWALERLRSPVDSRPESLLRLLLVMWGFPEPLVNDPTVVDDETAVLHPDLKWQQWRIVFEYEGDGHREDKTRFRADIRRKERFEAAGWRVIRVTSEDLFVDRSTFLARVRNIIAQQIAAMR